MIVNIKEDNKTKKYFREWIFRTSVPSEAAKNWHCKYIVRADRSLVSNQDKNKNGYIYLQIEQYGFDE